MRTPLYIVLGQFIISLSDTKGPVFPTLQRWAVYNRPALEGSVFARYLTNQIWRASAQPWQWVAFGFVRCNHSVLVLAHWLQCSRLFCRCMVSWLEVIATNLWSRFNARCRVYRTRSWIGPWDSTLSKSRKQKKKVHRQCTYFRIICFGRQWYNFFLGGGGGSKRGFG